MVHHFLFLRQNFTIRFRSCALGRLAHRIKMRLALQNASFFALIAPGDQTKTTPPSRAS
jgi:hypothetical protein